MFEVKNKMGHAVWNIADNGHVQRWCEIYDENGIPITFECEEESKQHIHSVLIPFLKTVLSELQNATDGDILLQHLPAVLQYAKRFLF